MARGVATFLLLALLGSGCATTRNFDDPLGPRFTGGVPPVRPPVRTLRILTFNLNFADALQEITAFLQDSAAARDADIILLQEADSASTVRLAAALGRTWVYVPAAWHPIPRRDYGNAILSAWPIVTSRKILLPHLGAWRLSRRTATAATVCVGRTGIRVYSTHFGTMSEIGDEARRDQLTTVLNDADAFPVAIVGGDFNSEDVAAAALERGYRWPTADLGPTLMLWTLDHLLVRGAEPLETEIVPTPAGLSDHRPVRITVRLDPAIVTDACRTE